MAMIRTIQHPGVEIQETEIGGYTSTVVMNNAYIMGFTDRGPIYDYSWIMNTRDFTKIYGEPQTEAEKYLFTAVQSVLANGGTPIVARMPYDNKQCKAYKALKMKWSDVTDFIGKPNDTDLASPLIPLSSVTAEINMNRDFEELFSTDTISINDQYVDEDTINSLTVSQMVKQLNPYKTGSEKSGGELWDGLEIGLKINGVYPSSLCVDQIAVSSLIDSIQYDQVKFIKKAYLYSEGLDMQNYETSGALLDSFIDDSDGIFYEIHDLYLKLFNSKGLSAYVNMFGDSTEELSGIPVYLPDAIPTEVGNLIMKDKDLSGYIKAPIKTTLKGDFDPENNKFLIPSSAVDILNHINSDKIEVGDIVGYFDFGAQVDYPVPTKVNRKEVYNQKNFASINEYLKPALLNGKVDQTSFLKVYPTTKDGETNGIPARSVQVVGRALPYGIEKEEKVIFLDELLPIYANTINGFPVNISTGEIVSNSQFKIGTDDEIVGFYNVDVESPAVTGTVNIGGREVNVYSEDTISSFVFSCNGTTKHYIDFDRGGTYKFNTGNYGSVVKSADVTYTYCYNIPYTGFLDDIPIVQMTDRTVAENEFLVWIKTIYNNVKFLKPTEENMIKLEASLMSTPEMGFKYGLYLDSEDCEISNDQYDDLVTVNQFKAVDRTIDKYGHDIDDANFIIVDKQKTVVQGVGGNIGFFTTVIDPFDALKVQRLLVNPTEAGRNASNREINVRDDEGRIISTKTVEFDHSDPNINRLDYWAYEAADSWNKIYDDLLDSMDCLQRVRNADGVYVGEPNPIDGKLNILDSWAVPLTGTYYEDSISKLLMRKFPGIAMADIDSSSFDDESYVPSIIDHQYATHIMVAVCKTSIDQSTGKVVVTLVETFFGSLFNEKSIQNGRSLFIGDIINGNSDYIEFYRNNYVSAGTQEDYAPPEYRRTKVNQIFIKDSEDLKNAALLRGIDSDDYNLDAFDPEVREEANRKYEKALAKNNIYIIDKKEVCVYNLHWEANFTSFSRKESQKVIANTSGLYSVNDGTTINVAKNFLIDMDRCINFIKNKDDIPLHFVCDAGLTTIAQFCDNIIWNPDKTTIVGEQVDMFGRKTGVKIRETTGGWVTQPFSPDDDPDGEDRYIQGYEDVATWRKVAEKLDSICSDIRKDCFCIIDAPRQLTLDGAAPKLRRSKFNNNFDKTIGRCLRFISGFNSSYSAGYYNWLRTTDQYTGKAMWIPPTSKIIGNYCYLNIQNLPWLAPAGLTYGLISGCHAISHNPDYQEEDQIYIKSWNYIKQYPVEGFVVEGQKTLLGKESVFERVNVRLLFLDLERFAYNVSRTFKYTVNNTYTREQFVATLKPKFEDYTLRGGIYEYLLKVDSENNTPETIDANELRGDIFIKPARLIEFILLNFVGTSTGTDFNELPMG